MPWASTVPQQRAHRTRVFSGFEIDLLMSVLLWAMMNNEPKGRSYAKSTVYTFGKVWLPELFNRGCLAGGLHPLNPLFIHFASSSLTRYPSFFRPYFQLSNGLLSLMIRLHDAIPPLHDAILPKSMPVSLRPR